MATISRMFGIFIEIGLIMFERGSIHLKIVVASDSFKGSLSSIQAGEAIAEGIRRRLPNADIHVFPVADGGEGTMDSLVHATGGRIVDVIVTGPLGKDVIAQYGCLGDGRTCVIEMASASGIVLVDKAELNPLLATTYGTGELIRHALDAGFRDFILGIGGSATNDGGIGMLQALGMKLLDSAAHSVGLGGAAVGDIERIDASHWDARIRESTFTIASDVENPLVGPSGASAVFGPQKGADPHMVDKLDASLQHFADVVEQYTGIRLHNRPGAGAAGGLGGAFQAFFPSRMERGIDVVLAYIGLREAMNDADVVFTGEGKLDAQTASGKTPMGVAQLAKQFNIPVFAMAGAVGQGIDILYDHGITSVHSIVSGPMSVEQAMADAKKLLADRAEQVIRTFAAIRR